MALDDLLTDRLPYDDPPAASVFFKTIAAIQNTADIELKVKAFAAHWPVCELLIRNLPYCFEAIAENTGIASIRFRLPFERSEDKLYACEFFVIDVPGLSNVVLIVSDCNRPTFKRLCTFVAKYWRHLIELGVNQSAFRDIVMHFESAMSGYDMRIRKVVKRSYAYRSLEDGNDNAEITWGSYSVGEAFERAAENRWWFKSISYELRPESSTLQRYRGIVSRNAFFNLSSHLIQIYRELVFPFCKRYQAAYFFLMDKARQKSQQYAAHPIQIGFSESIFDLPETNKEVISIFESYSRSSVSVLHGNPFLHLSVVDFRDGSSFDVIVLSNDRITIVPQLRATAQSLQRICEFIWDSFNEGIPGERISYQRSST